MRHHNKNRKFGREKTQRAALMRMLALSLIEKGKITTTEARAKSLRPFVEKLITKGLQKSVPSTRGVRASLGGDGMKGAKLLRNIAPRFAGRKGGYTRITKLPPKKSDGRRMAVIEFV